MQSRQNVTQHRVQVNFPEDLYQKVRHKAYRENSSISGVIRSIVRRNLILATQKSSTKNAWEKFFDRHIGTIHGNEDDSVSHDRWAHQTATFHER